MRTFLLNPYVIKTEFFLLCVLWPTLVIALKLAPYLFITLWLSALYTALVLAIAYRPNWRTLWGWAAVNWNTLQPILLRWGLCSAALTLLTWALFADKLFFLPREMPDLMLRVTFFYPALSALPQEFIFCTFFFLRYQNLFPKEWQMVLASALVFAYAHILFINWVAPLLGFLAGLIFARTYAQHKSLALVSIEHGLYGVSVFFIGIGYFFWRGSVG